MSKVATSDSKESMILRNTKLACTEMKKRNNRFGLLISVSPIATGRMVDQIGSCSRDNLPDHGRIIGESIDALRFAKTIKKMPHDPVFNF